MAAQIKPVITMIRKVKGQFGGSYKK